jgi:hypothetical protein
MSAPDILGLRAKVLRPDATKYALKRLAALSRGLYNAAAIFGTTSEVIVTSLHGI